MRGWRWVGWCGCLGFEWVGGCGVRASVCVCVRLPASVCVCVRERISVYLSECV